MKRWTTTVAAIAMVFAACGGGSESPSGEPESTTSGALQTTTSLADAEPGSDAGDGSEVALPAEIASLADVWPTDWAMRTIDLEELRRGLPANDPRDQIRPIDDPIYEDIAAADEWLDDRELGILLDLAGEARFYPVRILTSHEIVNDELADIPFSLTYCPLCNTAAAFDRRVDGQVLRFGVSGLLRKSDLVMWDDVTVSLWQQINGEAIVGDFAGTQLEFLPTALVPWSEFKANHPEGQALSRESGPFNYGSNPYVGYTSRSEPYGFFDEELDPRYPALSRVVGVRIDDAIKAYPFEVIAAERAVNDEVNGVPIAVFWGAAEAADPLDSAVIAEGQAIGTGVAFDRRVDGHVLTFAAEASDKFVDAETGTTWSLLGVAIDGPLSGAELEPVIHQNEFWFAWAAFNQGAPVYGE